MTASGADGPVTADPGGDEDAAATPPFAMLGEDDAGACADGACDVPTW